MSSMAESYILLRGLGRESGHWLEFVDVLRAAVTPAQVVCLDLPGNGYRCEETSPWSLHDVVPTLRADCAARGLSPPYRIIALSMGGMTGLSWLSQYPDDVAELVMINSSLASLSPVWHRMKPAAFLALLPGLLSVRWRERAVRALSCNIRRCDALMLNQFMQIAAARPVSASNMLRQLLAASRFRPALTATDPVLRRVRLLASEQDRLVDVRCSKRLAQAFDLPLDLHPRAGHDLPVEDPDWVVNTVGAQGRHLI